MTARHAGAMLCPICQTSLQMTERQGVEIDYCTQCRGVWLDRGELDKIIERSGAMQMESDRRFRGHDDDDFDEQDPRYRRRKRGWLGELLDFD
jgi:uncharacterized protein